MSVDRYYRFTRSPNFTCWHFASMVWADLGRPALTSFARNGLRRYPAPVDPCIVLFRGGRTSHVGVFIRGRVLHLGHYSPEHQPLEAVMHGFRKVSFYA